MNEVPIITDDAEDSVAPLPLSAKYGEHHFRLAWVRTTASFGQWYVCHISGDSLLLSHPSIGQKTIMVQPDAVVSITYL